MNRVAVILVAGALVASTAVSVGVSLLWPRPDASGVAGNNA